MRVSAAGTWTGAHSCLGVKLVGVAIRDLRTLPKLNRRYHRPLPLPRRPVCPGRRTPPPKQNCTLPGSSPHTPGRPSARRRQSPPPPARPSVASGRRSQGAPSPSASPRRRPQSAPARAGRPLGLTHRQLRLVTEPLPPVHETQVHHSTL